MLVVTLELFGVSVGVEAETDERVANFFSGTSMASDMSHFSYICNRNGGLLFFIVWHRDTKCQWQVYYM